MPRSLDDWRRSEATALPGWIKPQLTRLVDQAPDGPDWLHEIKFDGYRMHARLDRGAVRLLTRTGLDWTRKYPAIAGAVALRPARQDVARAASDGPVIVGADDADLAVRPAKTEDELFGLFSPLACKHASFNDASSKDSKLIEYHIFLMFAAIVATIG